MILLTTSRRPSRRMRTFCNDLARVIPNTQRINRGKLSIDGVAEKALEINANKVILVCRWKGGPGKIELFRVGARGLIPFPPLIRIKGVRLQREFKLRKIEPTRSLVIAVPPEETAENIKIAESLSNFLEVPMMSMDKVSSKNQIVMQVRSHPEGYSQITFLRFPQRVEVGPRITIRSVIW